MNEYNNIPKVPEHLFSLIDATRKAFIFVIEEKKYLARISVPVICLQVFFSMAIFMFDKEASSMRMFLYEMPVAVFMGWFTFCLIRLAIFGERFYALPLQDVRFMQYRAYLMKATILCTILIKAIMSGLAEVSLYLSETTPSGAVMPPYMVIGSLIAVVFVFWSFRFLVVPILLATDYPLKVFLKQITGFHFSFRLFGLILMCAFPAFMIMNLFSNFLIVDIKNITEIEMMLLLLLQAPFSVIFSALISAGMCFALKEMLSGNNSK